MGIPEISRPPAAPEFVPDRRVGEQLDVEDVSYGLIVVHRWNVREPRERTARWRIAVVTDILLHSLATLIVFGSFLIGHPDPSIFAVLLALPGSYLVVSFMHRVLFQWAFRSTVGKLLLGVVLVRTDTRERPSLRRLAGVWLGSLFITLASLLDGL
jgi:hypothetical protein